MPRSHRPLQRPRDYRFVEALPKNNYGKVLKTELRRLLTDNPEEGRPTR
jgi:long-chain acyl-CoA synthetase